MKLRLLLAAAAMAGCFPASAQSPEPAGDADAVDAALDAAADALEEVAEQAGVGEEELTTDEVESEGLWKPNDHYDPRFDEFVAAVKGLDGQGGAAERAVAAKYEMSVPALRETVRFLREMYRDRYEDRHAAALQRAAWRLVEGGNRSPITLMIAAAAISDLGDSIECTSGDIERLMRGSSDPDADMWAVATSCWSSNAMATALERSTKARPALSYLAMNWTRTDPASDLAAVDMLLRPEFLVQVNAAERGQVHADIAGYKLAKLLNVGLFDQAVAFGDSLDRAVLEAALTAKRGKIRATIGGFRLQTDRYGGPEASDYAAALALAGRFDDARRVLNIIAPAAKRNEARACLDAAKESCPVGDGLDKGVPLAALVVDHFLDQPEADPYNLIESQAGFLSTGFGAAGALICKMPLRPDEAEECEGEFGSFADRRAEKEDDDFDRALWATIRRLGGASFEATRAGYAAKLAALGPVEQEPEKDWSRASVDPAPVPFKELRLPAEALARKPSAGPDPDSFASLPGGYQPVRFERSGQRAAAISISQRFDPNGEVTAGGYWLHLSEDGGKSWQPPLYTGLAEHFPYIVPAKARLPMLAGDHIRLEVEEALLDTASISYPPVGIALKRKRKGIYLDIPIAELAQDSDGDGLTDIAARHLLLDQPASGSKPFIVGTDQGCSAPAADTLARLEILKKIFAVEAQALIEPAGGRRELLGPWRKSMPSEKPPIFLQGNPDDYRCVAIDRPMIIYSEADRERLRKFSPDFQLITLPPIRWNRDHTRGFVNWSMGWVGGTYRIIRDGSGWKLESIREWIT